MAFKTFNVGDVLTASDVNTYLMKQEVIGCTAGTRPSSPNDGMPIYETDTKSLLVHDGASFKIPSLRSVIKPTTQNVNNSTTLTNDNDLLAAFSTTATYEFRLHLIYRSSTTADLKIAFTFTNVSSCSLTVMGVDTALAFLQNSSSGYASGTAVALGGNGIGTNVGAFVVGNLTTTGAGTLQLQFAQNTAVVENDGVQSGSHLILSRLT